MKNLERRVFIVTGGASGLGEATARKLVAAGSRVVLIDLNEQRGKQLASELGGDRHVLFVKANIIDEKQVQQAIECALSHFGDGFYLSGAINCAGVADAKTVVSEKRGPYPLQDFKRVIDINLIGSFNILRLVAQQLIKQQEPDFDDGERGVFINVASVAAFEGQIGQAAYSASKGAIVSMALPIARELSKYKIRVVTIAPGIFSTPMLDAMPEKVRTSLARQVPYPSRFGSGEEFAETVLFILECQYINAETLRLDGAVRMSAM